jgi:predicted HicB family RNase H-like nuclease
MKKQTRGSKSPKTTNLHIRCDPELLELIEKAATKDERSVSQWVRLVLRREAEKNQ